MIGHDQGNSAPVVDAAAQAGDRGVGLEQEQGGEASHRHDQPGSQQLDLSLQVRAALLDLRRLGIPVARCELLDALTISAVNQHSRLTLREAPTLFCEFHGTQAGVEEQSRTVQDIAKDLGGLDFEWATQQEARTQLWQARHDAYLACRRLRPGNLAFSTDVCVPISRLAECIARTNEDISGASMPVALFGHVGDGNFHLVVLIDPGNAAEIAEAEQLNHRVVMRALEMGGTCTGEHGVGYGKAKFLRKEHGDAAVEVMRTLKASLDPDNIMNPGKVLPPPLD